MMLSNDLSLLRRSAVLLYLVVSLCDQSNGMTQVNTGFGILYRLEDTQDAWVETTYSVIYRGPLMLVGNEAGFPKKRFLVQFEDIPVSCKRLISAKMHVYFLWGQFSPTNLPRTLQVHQIISSWIETQVSTTYRQTSPTSLLWSQPYLGLDDKDAVWYSQSSFTIYPNQPDSYVSFDITEAARNWKQGDPNNGVLVWATNEDVPGSDLRFASRRYGNSTLPHVNVLCAY